MSQFKIDLSQALIEFITSGELPTPLVYGLSAVLLAIAWKIATWRKQ